jgi:chloramphenicol-sensitive protein RarD
MQYRRLVRSDSAKGALAAAVAFLTWGLSPIFWKALGHVPSGRLLAHRVFWSLVVMLVIVVAVGGAKALWTAFRSWKALGLIVLSSLLLSTNWLTFLWAVTHGHVVECSLGYFITPLFSVLLGSVFLHEKLNRFHLAALCLAGAGVLNLALRYGRVPWIALSLTATFGVYGLIRKTSRLDSVAGFAAESLVMAPFAIVYLAATRGQGEAATQAFAVADAMLLIGTGLITALPLVCFAYGARRIRLSTVGFMHYIAPTGQFLLGVFVYGEDLSRVHLVTFALIWLGVAAYWLGVVRPRKPRPL